jgi:transcriptional regulator
MYTPPAFAEDRPEVMLAFVEANPLGALVTAAPDADGAGLLASHLPFVVDRSRGAHGTLVGHLARANPHAAHLAAARDALVIFPGPDAYVSPAHYASKAEHGRVVPTWNYVAVHAHGTLRRVDDPAALLAHLDAITRRHEAPRAHPWSLADAPAGYIEQTMRGTVLLEVEIARLVGKWKMSQNRPAADIAGVVEGLGASSSPRERAVGAIVAERRPGSKR